MNILKKWKGYKDDKVKTIQSLNFLRGSHWKNIPQSFGNLISGNSLKMTLHEVIAWLIEAIGIYFDYSKHLITDETLKSPFEVD